MRTTLTLALLLSAIAGSTANAATAKQPSAQDILRRVDRVYTTCKSYRDTGTVTGETQEAEGKFTLPTVTFKTMFSRPNRFRFEYTSKSEVMGSDRMVIWTDGDKTLVWWTVNGKTKAEESLEMAIAGATGVSSGSAHTVPRLLLPSIGGWKTTDLDAPRLLATESIDKAKCYKIQGRLPKRKDTCTLWIGSRDYLIRKIVMVTPRLPGIETTVYHPEINATVPPTAFRSGVHN